MSIIFKKADWEDLDISTPNISYDYRGGIKTKKGGKYENQYKSEWARNVPLAQKRKIRGHFMYKRQKVKNIFDWS